MSDSRSLLSITETKSDQEPALQIQFVRTNNTAKSSVYKIVNQNCLLLWSSHDAARPQAISHTRF